MNSNNYDNTSEGVLRPLIFTKKVNDKYKVIPFNETKNTLGQTRHFPPATREWFNSVYAYNANSIKNLPSADKNLSKIIKSYFNLYFNKSILKSKRIATRYRRLDFKKIFVSKAELKHTSSKVIITLYVYNEERRLLSSKIKSLEKKLFSKGKNLSLNWKKELFLINKEKLSLLKELDIVSIFEKFNSGNLTLHKDFTLSSLEEEIKTIAYYKLLLNLNRSKFEDNFLSKLKPLISRIYNKEVEFNIVNLKTLYFNSDIFTQAISMKLKNRDNKLLRVLKSSLRLVKLPIINKMREKYGKDNREQLWLNKVKNLKVNNFIAETSLCFTKSMKQNNDILNQLLLNVFPNAGALTTSCVTMQEEMKEEENNRNLVINSLKYKSMAGARLEAKGRLTKRFTASRSVFKVKWKGSLKNIDSSYKGLSSVILRGHVKPNVQYSIINSKNRNGSFGLKGWVGSK